MSDTPRPTDSGPSKRPESNETTHPPSSQGARQGTESYKQLLGFDFGVTKIGVATGQAITSTATPLTIIKARDGIPNWDDIDQLIKEWQPDALVVGNPLNMDGSDSDITPRAKKFSRRMAARYNIKSFLMDERLSTREARERAEMLGQSGQVDAIAAAVILENWLQQSKKPQSNTNR